MVINMCARQIGLEIRKTVAPRAREPSNTPNTRNAGIRKVAMISAAHRVPTRPKHMHTSRTHTQAQPFNEKRQIFLKTIKTRVGGRASEMCELQRGDHPGFGRVVLVHADHTACRSANESQVRNSNSPAFSTSMSMHTNQRTARQIADSTA